MRTIKNLGANFKGYLDKPQMIQENIVLSSQSHPSFSNQGLPSQHPHSVPNLMCPLVLDENTGIGLQLSWHRLPWKHVRHPFPGSPSMLGSNVLCTFLHQKDSKGFSVTLIPLPRHFSYSPAFFLDHLAMFWLLSREDKCPPTSAVVYLRASIKTRGQKWRRISLEFALWGLCHSHYFLKLFWKSLEK